MNYNVITRETGLTVWPYAVTLEIHSPIDNPFVLRRDITNWLESNRIKYNYNSGFDWYFKDGKALAMFVMRWS